MRTSASFFVLVFALLSGCGTGVDRLPGEGCQPACVVLDTERDVPGDRQVQCLDEDEDPQPCAALSVQPLCEGTDVPACGDGAPTCVSGTPTCR